MLAPAPHLASPCSPETARLEFLSTYSRKVTLEETKGRQVSYDDLALPSPFPQ